MSLKLYNSYKPLLTDPKKYPDLQRVFLGLGPVIEMSEEAQQMDRMMATGGVSQVVEEEAIPQQAPAGPPSGVIETENASPSETVADDIPMDVPEGSFIINAAAAEVAGYGDIKTMIMDAIGVARRLGVEVSAGNEQASDEEAVDLLVSKGEVYIEPTLAKIIGYDVLEKINNRGKREVARRQQEAEAKQQQQPQQAPQPQMAQIGGFIASGLSDEEKERLFNVTDPYVGVNEDPPDRPLPDINMEPEPYSGPPIVDEIKERAKTANDNLHDFLVSAFRKEKYEKLIYDGPSKIEKFKKNHVDDYRGSLDRFYTERAIKDWFDDNPELANDLLNGYNDQYHYSPEWQLKDTFFSSALTKLRGELEDRYASAAYFLSGLPIAQNRAKLRALQMTGEGYSYPEIPSILSKEGRVTDFDPRIFSRKPLINPETGKEYVEKQVGGSVKKNFADGGMSFDDKLKAAVSRVTGETNIQDTPDQIQEEPPEQIAVNQTPRRGAPRSFTRTSGDPIYNYEQHTVHSPATARQAMKDFVPNTHLVSYDVFKDISEQGNDDVVFPLMDLFFSQPGRTDSIKYPTSSDKEIDILIEGIRQPTRGTNYRGDYDIDADRINLIRDPISHRLELARDKLRAEDYAFYRGTALPYFTRIRDTFTAAHEMMHGALERESVSPKFNARQQHFVTDYIFPNILLKGKDVLIDQFGEEDYKRTLVNYIMELGVHHTRPLLQTPMQRYEGLRDEFHDLVITDQYGNIDESGEYETYALKDIPVEKLMKRLQKELKVASRKTNFKKYADAILSQIDFEEVKRITGKPESLKTRTQAKTKRDSGGFIPKK